MAVGQEEANQKEGVPERNFGKLYVVCTPIGNLEDITLRALNILKQVNMIAAENVNHTRRLCQHYRIQTPLTAYHQHNHPIRSGRLIQQILSGMDIAVVSSAGAPGISDPGVHLVRAAVEKGISVVPVPGPSALVAALSVAGLPTDSFLFAGFLSNRPGKRKKELTDLASQPRTLVFFEAPHRIRETLKDMHEILGDRELVLLREMTKVFEEVRRGTVKEILETMTQEEARGEFTLVVEGQKSREDTNRLGPGAGKRIDRLLMEPGMSLRDAAHRVAREEEVPFRQAYRECLLRKKALEGTDAHGADQGVEG